MLLYNVNESTQTFASFSYTTATVWYKPIFFEEPPFGGKVLHMETAYGKMRLCENKESLARYHAAVHFTVGNIIEDCPSFSQPVDVKKFDRQTIAAIAEIVFRK